MGPDTAVAVGQCAELPSCRRHAGAALAAGFPARVSPSGIAAEESGDGPPERESRVSAAPATAPEGYLVNAGEAARKG